MPRREPCDQTLLRTVVRGEVAAPGPRYALARAIARRDGGALIAAARDEVTRPLMHPLDRLRLAEAVAEHDRPLAEHVFHGTRPAWPRAVAVRFQAALALAESGTAVADGAVDLMPGQALPIVEATVDGQRGVFIVDTGAPHSALSRRWCVDRGLAWNGAVSHPVDDGAGTRIPAEAVRLGHVAAGGQARDVPAVVFDFPPGLAVAGILSPLDVFGGRPVRLDLRARRLVVGEATGDAGAGLPFTAPLHWRGGVPLVAARVAGRPGFLMVDSGAGGVVLCRAYARISGLHTPQATTTMSAAGALAVGVGLRAGIAVGGSAEVQADIALKPCRTVGPAAPVLALDGLLGVGWLGGRILDFSRDRLSLGFDERVPAA